MKVCSHIYYMGNFSHLNIIVGKFKFLIGRWKGGMCTEEAATNVFTIQAQFKALLRMLYLFLLFPEHGDNLFNQSSLRFLSSLPGKCFLILQWRRAFWIHSWWMQNCGINSEIRILGSLVLLLTSYIGSIIILILEGIILSFLPWERNMLNSALGI